MKPLGVNEIREKYLSFFESKGHLRLKSFSLVPHGDASLLLINAGMAPLKPYFTGQEEPPRKRVTTCQKCIRTPDIERVGKTARHGTFFEMLGNFSFGDYFKNEATAWAWEFVTEVLEIPKDKLWITIYENDDEAFDIWTKKVGVPAERIVRMGKEDNFWEIGTGPCGPCSELYFDRGPEHGCGSPDCKVGCECDRFVEFWNLVFTQFDRDEDGNYNSLPNPNIDTGMGLERMAVIMQGVDNLFEVDTIQSIMKHISEIAGVPYHKSDRTDVSLRVITDHIRSTTMMVSDGIMPSNEGRGYVLRRLLRRAARHGKLLGIDKPFLYQVAGTVIEASKEAYPELSEKKEYIERVILTEEKRFDETIDAGLSILNDYMAEAKAEGKTELSGEKAFKLYDTYGFPIDLTLEIVEENGMTVDRDGFDSEMEAQRVRAREARKVGEGAAWDDNVFTQMDKSITSRFLGYDNLTGSGKVLAIVAGDEEVGTVMEGDEATVILDETVFYGESGGQVGDTGVLSAEGFEFAVEDTKKMADGKILHVGRVTKGTLSVGDTVNGAVDASRRKAITRNHSAAHILQQALKDVLGSHVAQAGSLVTPERLRFDFNHFSAMTEEELAAVEAKMNQVILENLKVTKEELPIEEAKKKGATALFGEKYGKTVRVVSMGDYSIEFCGGCHVDQTAEVGLVKILSESGVAAGVRRIEAVTGLNVLKLLAEKEDIIQKTASTLKCAAAEMPHKAETLEEELKNQAKEISALKAEAAKGKYQELLTNAEKVGDVSVITYRSSDMDIETLKQMGDMLRDKEPGAVAVLAAVGEDKVTFVAVAGKDAVKAGVHAGNLVKETAKITGGGGGGRPDMAQAGGKNPAKTDEALKAVLEVVKGQLK